MKFTVIGAGGIGCYYAARLIEAGETVTLVARGEHLRATCENGLQMRHPELNFHQAVDVSTLDEWLDNTHPEQVDVVIVCLKGMQTASFAKQLAVWLEKHEGAKAPVVLSLQNGVENEKHLKEAVPKLLILGGIARRIGAHIIEPGVVEAVGPAEVILGAWPNQQQIDSKDLVYVNQLADCFNNAHIPTEVSEDINKELWRKLIVNNGVNPLCALLEMETGEATHHANLLPLIRGAMEESAIAAKANNVELSEQDVEGMFQLISTFDSIKPSMLVDREKGKPLEMEEICGVVIRGCELLGKDAPYNRCISTLLAVEISKQQV